MVSDKVYVYVYLHQYDMPDAKLIGTLTAVMTKNRRVFSFEYNKAWLKSEKPFFLDPDINWYSGTQYPGNKSNFGIVFDSMPDTWGRTLVKRKMALLDKENNQHPRILHDLDFLLAVHDKNRLGALRFKTDKNGDFLDNDDSIAIPPWSYIRELQYSAKVIEGDENSPELKKWLAILMAPGSSLGGTRPKANILDITNQAWIAKFPAKNDTINRALWEYLVYKLALQAGINMSESKIEKIAGNHHTFFTKRFDRIKHKRIHFSSAMSLTGNIEEAIKEDIPSYLEIAEFIQFSGTNIKKELHQLWRRIVFNIAISNTDDHMRNHGFILQNGVWHLSPAFDINPSVDKQGLALNIDMENNSLDFELARSVGGYFQLNISQMSKILDEVKTSVRKWHSLAKQLGIPIKEQEIMKAAFDLDKKN